ncbi:hypothetical protein EMMF5_005446 [Cystobasidiomycetes sp. EMM_F5]
MDSGSVGSQQYAQNALPLQGGQNGQTFDTLAGQVDSARLAFKIQARVAILHDLAKSDPRFQLELPASAVSKISGTAIAASPSVSLSAIPEPSAQNAAFLPEQQDTLNATQQPHGMHTEASLTIITPFDQTTSTLLDGDDMEDLFGPPTGAPTQSSNFPTPVPANAATAPPLPVQASSASQQSTGATGTYDAIDFQAYGIDDPVTLNDFDDMTFGVASTDNNDLNQDLGFQNMSTDDFNALLAGLGDQGGSQPSWM